MTIPEPVRKRDYNHYGVPIYNKQELAVIRKEILSRPCKSCGARARSRCKNPDGTKMASGTCHIGRLPKGFDSLKIANDSNP